MTPLFKFIPSESKGHSELKILWVTNFWPDEMRPYYGNYVRSQAQSLWDLGLDVDVCFVRGFVSKRAYFETLPEVRRRMQDPRYQLVHVHYGHTAAMAVTAMRHPLVISFCGEDLLGAPRERGKTLKSTIESAIFRHLPRFADATITKSREMELALPESLRGRNTVLPNGVDVEVFARGPQADARRAVGWELDGRVAMFLGDPEDPRKRVELAHEAMQIVRERMPDARLEVAFGFNPEMVPALMNAADCLVFPSRSEGSPNAVKEAMAAALPIVATPVGDIPERLGGVEGCFVREPRPEAFAEAIAQALEIRHAPAARAAVEEISIQAVANRLRDIYVGLL
jgi:teichuronic acid biosynthesis glycosyltransferase TuaC